MGPTNIALVRLFKAETNLRDAHVRLDSVSRDVRIQQRKVNDLTERKQQITERLMQLQASYTSTDLDIRARDEHITKLREAQQLTKNNRDYQQLAIEISTRKVDRNKVEEQALRQLEEIERCQKEKAVIEQQLVSEDEKLRAALASVGGRMAELQEEIDRLKPIRDQAASEVPPQPLSLFERLADRYEGEAMAAITRPDPRYEEYMCGACNVDLVVDTYNRLHSRDELVTCPSCKRILFIPEEFSPEKAVKQTKSKSTRAKKPTKSSKVEIGGKVEVSNLLTPQQKLLVLIGQAQSESVRAAIEADHAPVVCLVKINGELVGEFKGKTPEQLQRAIKLVLSENDQPDATVEVRLKSQVEAETGGSSHGVGPNGEASGDVPLVDGSDLGLVESSSDTRDNATL